MAAQLGPNVVLMGDPRVAAVEVRESGESLIDLREYEKIVISPRKSQENPSLGLIRAAVGHKLAAASAGLPDGIRLCVVEAYRPPRLQQFYFDGYRNRLAADAPDRPDDELDMLASRFVSPPLVAPHPSGAAVDLTLVDTDGVELDMGTPVDATPEASDGACYTDAANLTSMARANRRILSVALTAVGLINYPTEWWHWSYGDRYWAMSVQAAHAHYGPVDDPGATR